MAFIPDDILDECLKLSNVDDDDVPESAVLLGYAAIIQKEGTEPEAQRIAAFGNFPVDKVKAILEKQAERGWLARVKDYSE